MTANIITNCAPGYMRNSLQYTITSVLTSRPT